MEGNYLTSGDLAMWENRRCGDNYGCCHRNERGMAATGIGLGAGLGGGALLLSGCRYLCLICLSGLD